MKKRKLNKKNLFLLLMIFAFFVLSIISGVKIINYFIDNHKNKVIQENIVEKSIKIIETKKEEPVKYEVDFKSLKKQNPDIIAYLKVPGTNIDYVVVKGNDNEYYLNHNINKEKNVSGWIFADYHNTFNTTDKNIVIYGHNTRNGSMFGTLKNILNKDWYENTDNRKILLITELGTYYYQVFSTYTIEPEDYYINTDFASNEEFETFINKIKKRSIYNYGVNISIEDKILTLSSCISEGKKRVVLHAKLIGD